MAHPPHPPLPAAVMAPALQAIAAVALPAAALAEVVALPAAVVVVADAINSHSLPFNYLIYLT